MPQASPQRFAATMASAIGLAAASVLGTAAQANTGGVPEVGAFYWTVPAPDIVNSEREEQGLISV